MTANRDADLASPFHRFAGGKHGSRLDPASPAELDGVPVRETGGRMRRD